MLLLIDIGNSNITIGLYENDIIKDTLRLRTTIGGQDIERYSAVLDNLIHERGMPKPGGAAICSVVPRVTPLLAGAVQRTFDIEPLNVTHGIKTGLSFSIKNIEELGPDRIAGAVAAHNLYKGNLVVADFGTATTFNVITEEGEYKGGVIMPGLGLSADTLAEKTAKLPGIELNAPVSIPGRDTVENILAGVILGHAGAVERIIKEMKKELERDLLLVATGGFSDLIKPYIEIDYLNPFLTLHGLRFIYEMNSGFLLKSVPVKETINSGG